MYIDKNEFYVYPKILADTWWPRWICCSLYICPSRINDAIIASPQGLS